MILLRSNVVKKHFATRRSHRHQRPMPADRPNSSGQDFNWQNSDVDSTALQISVFIPEKILFMPWNRPLLVRKKDPTPQPPLSRSPAGYDSIISVLQTKQTNYNIDIWLFYIEPCYYIGSYWIILVSKRSWFRPLVGDNSGNWTVLTVSSVFASQNNNCCLQPTASNFSSGLWQMHTHSDKFNSRRICTCSNVSTSSMYK